MKPVAAAALLLLALACAGAASAATSRAEFIRKGDAICARTLRELVPIQQQAQAAKALPDAEKWAAGARVWAAQIEVQKRMGASFRALELPRGDRTARSLVAGLRSGVVLADRVRAAFAARDEAALAVTLPAYVQYTLDLNRRVVRYGFKVCGRS